MFVRAKRKGIGTYYELVESRRTGRKVSQRVVKYLGTKRKMMEYCERNGIAPPCTEGLLDAKTAAALEVKLRELDSKRPLPAATLESLRRKFEVEMTYNSNAIEGNRLSLKETFLVLEKGMTIGGRSMREHLEATNHREALLLLEKMAKRDGRIAEKDVLELHATIMDKIDPSNAGFYRRAQVYITGSRHRPPNWKEVPERMRAVLKELNSTARGAGAVESASKLHHLVVWIHPFVDGNGRLARLLTNLRLMRAGFPPIVLQRRIRKSYYDALEKADDGDLTQFAALVARDVGSALDLWLEAAA